MSTTRQPKGIPVGGQFAATAHAEPDGASLVGVRIGEPREMTRDELVMVGRAVPGNPALSEATRVMASRRRDVAQAISAMDEAMLNAAVIHVRQILPGAKEIRMRAMSTGNFDRVMTPTFVRTTDDGFIGANYAKAANADWARRTVEGSDPGSVTEALASVTPHSDIWDTDPRCDYDPQTEEHIIYLDGRRRQEH